MSDKRIRCQICGIEKLEIELLAHHYAHFRLCRLLQSSRISSSHLNDTTLDKMSKIFGRCKITNLTEISKHKFPAYVKKLYDVGLVASARHAMFHQSDSQSSVRIKASQIIQEMAFIFAGIVFLCNLAYAVK